MKKDKKQEMMFNSMRGHVCVFIACVVFFLLFPSVDVWVSSLFFDEQSGFFFNEYMIVRAIYKGTEYMALIIVLSVLLRLLVGYMIQGIDKHFNWQSVFLITCLLVGPGLLVNSTFKEHWDRARPRSIEAFGGEATFTPPWIPAQQCKSNCSFVSGHASAGFFLMAFGFMGTLATRRKWWFAGLIAGGIIGGTRVIQGGHFLSDVIFCYFVLWFTFTGLEALFNHYKQLKGQWLLDYESFLGDVDDLDV